jgi:hypothetical protein
MPKTAAREKPLKTAEKTRHIESEPARATSQPLAETEVVATAPGCAHHWVIASPDGEMSLGRCKVCGAEKEFPNSAEDYLWERSVPQSRWTGRADPKSFSDGF